MKKIKIEHYSGIHYHAMCTTCGFSPHICTNETQTRVDVRKAVRKHVLETGHEVVIDCGIETYYLLKS